MSFLPFLTTFEVVLDVFAIFSVLSVIVSLNA